MERRRIFEVWKRREEKKSDSVNQGRVKIKRCRGDGLIRLIRLPYTGLSPDLIYAGFSVHLQRERETKPRFSFQDVCQWRCSMKSTISDIKLSQSVRKKRDPANKPKRYEWNQGYGSSEKTDYLTTE
jgi:hypothetical protein